MKRRPWIFILVMGVFIGCSLLGGLCLLAWFFWKPTITPAPKRDIVFQIFTQDYDTERRTTELGFINADGSGREIQAVLDSTIMVAKAPFGFPPYFGFLIDGRPYVRNGGRLYLFHLPEWKEVRCRYFLRWRPYPVGDTGAWVGEYRWAEDGGLLLFWPDRPGCPKEDLWSRQELADLGVLRLDDPFDRVGFVAVMAFHREPAILMFGQGIHRWDLETRRLEPWGTWITGCPYGGELSYDDAYLACVEEDEEGAHIRVWDLRREKLWRERLISKLWVPRYGIEVSWSPDGTALVYHRCVEPDVNFARPACEEQGRENLALFIWDLKTDKERLLTRGGVMPFWIKWEE